MSTQGARGDHTETAADRLFSLDVAIVLALTVGFIDVMVSTLLKPSELGRFVDVFPPLAATAVFSFVACGIPFIFLSRWLAGAPRLERRGVIIAFAAFLGGGFTLLRLFDFSYSPTNLIRASILTVLSALLGVGAYFAFTTASAANTRTDRLGVCWILSPVALAAVLTILWIDCYRVGALLSFGTVLLAFALVFVLLLLFGISFRRPNLSSSRKALYALAIVVCVSPLAPVVWPSDTVSFSDGTSVKTTIKHVILIVIDSLRSDALSCYRPDAAPTPHIDALAADGVLFADAVSAGPWTLPGMTSMLSGLTPFTHLATGTYSGVSDSLTTLAEVMGGHGYLTSAIGTNIVLIPSRGVSQGFSRYEWYPKPSDDTSFGKRILRRAFATHYRSDVSTAEITDLAVDWLHTNRDKSSMLWIHYFDPHHPYSPPPGYTPNRVAPASMGTEFTKRTKVQDGTLMLSEEEREWVRDLYLAEVRYVDDNIGRLVQAMKQLDIYDESLIVLTSDHGEEFWDHDRLEHGHTLYRELLSVPLVIKLPGSERRGRIDETVTTQSIYPTVLELCQIPYDEGRLESGSLVPLWLQGMRAYESHPIIGSGVMYYEDQECLYFDRFKYIRSRVTGREQLFDRVADPDERNSIAPSMPEAVLRARQVLDECARKAEKVRKTYGIEQRSIKHDEETLKRLKSLGYM